MHRLEAEPSRLTRVCRHQPEAAVISIRAGLVGGQPRVYALLATRRVCVFALVEGVLEPADEIVLPTGDNLAFAPSLMELEAE